MQLWVVVLAWSINVLGLSLALAIFEIVVEKEKGWASGANPKKLFPGGVVANICEKPYLTAYHLFLFALIVPLILWAELLLLEGAGITHSVFGNLSVKPVGHFVMRIGEVSFMPVFFLAAAWLCILVVEDLLWFLLNWHYPKSMDDLLSGKVWWHTRWLTLGSIKLPRFYLTVSLVAAVFLAAGLSPHWLALAAIHK